MSTRFNLNRFFRWSSSSSSEVQSSSFFSLLGTCNKCPCLTLRSGGVFSFPEIRVKYGESRKTSHLWLWDNSSGIAASAPVFGVLLAARSEKNSNLYSLASQIKLLSEGKKGEKGKRSMVNVRITRPKGNGWRRGNKPSIYLSVSL